jgi:hypothetical protein
LLAALDYFSKQDQARDITSCLSLLLATLLLLLWVRYLSAASPIVGLARDVQGVKDVVPEQLLQDKPKVTRFLGQADEKKLELLPSKLWN